MAHRLETFLLKWRHRPPCDTNYFFLLTRHSEYFFILRTYIWLNFSTVFSSNIDTSPNVTIVVTTSNGYQQAQSRASRPFEAVSIASSLKLFLYLRVWTKTLGPESCIGTFRVTVFTGRFAKVVLSLTT